MKFLLFILIILIFSIVDGEQCQGKFNQSIVGQCSSISNCQGSILNSNSCEQQRCCVSTIPLSSLPICITANDFDVFYNTSRATFLRTVLNYGLNLAGICENCQSKAAYLAIAATMTENFQTDEAIGSDSQFSTDDNKYGNSQKGDGSRFRRRGFFGLRGREMYRRLQTLLPQYQLLTNPESAALIQNSIIIASKLWTNPNLINESTLTQYADGSFYGFSMLWYKLTGNSEQLSTAAKYYSTFLRQFQCGGDLYNGQGPVCQYNTTHNGTCSADCIKGLEDSSTYCGCSGPIGAQCPNSPKHIRCCLDTCSQQLKMDLGFVLDASGSIIPSDYRLQLQFTKDLLTRVDVGQNKTHVGIINYSTSFQILTWLNKDYNLTQKLAKVDQAVHYALGTDTALALEQANILFSYTNGRRHSEEGVTPVIFVITDGKSNNPNATIKAAKFLKQQDIVLVSVGVGNGPDLNELHAICSPPASENYFSISNYNALYQKLTQFTSKSCSEPVPVSSNTTIDIEISKDKYKFLKVEIIKIGKKFLITVTLFNGNVKLFYSFKNRNPKDPDDFIDYETKTINNKHSLISTQFFTKTNTVNNNQVTLVIDQPDDNVEFAYIGIKGIDENNKFKVNFDDCEEVICSKSNVFMIKLSFILSILCTLFIL